MIPLQAAQTLLSSLSSLQSRALTAAAACRITGHAFPVDDPLSSIPNWVPSDVSLREALRLDTSLFVVEAQNLFVDPARDAKNWAAVLSPSADKEVLDALAAWAAPGLEVLAELVGSSDGVLGWASRGDVLAVVVRIVTCCEVLSGKGHPGLERRFEELRGEVATFL